MMAKSPNLFSMFYYLQQRGTKEVSEGWMHTVQGHLH